MSDTPVDDYLAGLHGIRRDRIARVYEIARELAPDAVQATKYAMPCLAIGGKGLVSAMSTAKHIGIYPFSGGAIEAHREELAALGIATTKGAIQLRDATEMPDEVIAAVIATRLAQIT